MFSTSRILLNVVLGAVLVAILGIGALAYVSVRQITASTQWVSHTQGVIADVKTLSDLASQALRAQRSFVITGAPVHRAAFAQTRARVAPAAQALRASVADNAAQVGRVARFERLVYVAFARMDGILRVYDAEGEAAAQALLARDATMGLDPALDALAEMEAAERAMLAARSDAADASVRRAALVVLISSVLTFLFLGIAVVVINRDLNERARARAVLRESRAEIAALVDTSGSMIVAVDEGGQVTTFNQEAERLSGLAAGAVVGRPLAEVFAPGSGVESLDALLGRALGGESVRDHDAVLLHVQGDPHTLVWNVNPLRHDDGTVRGAVASGTEITARKNAEARLQYDAFHDPLTGLLNRRGLRNRLERLVDEGTGGAVLFLDLDGFKAVNDTHGHDAGDLLLKEIAARLRQALRSHDVLARLGGDEFAAVLVGADEAATAEVARRLLAFVNQPVSLGDRAAHVSASIGSARLDSGLSVDAVVGEADAAMYRAKALGRNRYVGEGVAVAPEDERRRRIELDLPGAAARGELRLHYQPLVRLHDGALAGFEALVRWQHPTLGLVAPLDFIPYAERSGLSGEIGAWVLEAACREFHAWRAARAQGLLLMIAVNFSRDQFVAPDAVRRVEQVLQSTGLPPGSLVIEVTERVLEVDDPAVIERLAQLRAMGVQLALDDFGSGFSALSALGRLPLHILKLDRGFIRDLSTSGPVFEVMRSVVELARRLGLRVVAEGIESPFHADILRGLGCDYGQGFLYSKPVDAAGALALLRAHPAPATRAAPGLAPPPTSDSGTAWR